jgi:hypothetical protein
MTVQSLLESGLAGEAIPSLVRTAMREHEPDGTFEQYFNAVDAACDAVKPIFDTTNYFNTYRKLAENDNWFAVSLIKAAEREGEGATRLWSLSACSSDEREAQLIKRHAIDESGHSVAYLSLLDMVFPEAVDSDFRVQLKGLSPYYKMSDTPVEGANPEYAHNPTIDDYIQMNIAEIRTTIHHLLQREALWKYCPEESVSRVEGVLNKLLRDELAHVSYTGALIEEKVRELGAEKINRYYERRLRDFHEITHEEVKNLEFD